MIYEVIKAATGMVEGETYSLDELAKKGDVNNMVRKGIVRSVGFVSLGAPLTDADAARQIGELQSKLEKAEDERDQARDELKTANRKIRVMEIGHVEGAKQLAAAQAEAESYAAEVDVLTARLKVAEAKGGRTAAV